MVSNKFYVKYMIVSSANELMYLELTHRRGKKAVKNFLFSRQLLAWDTYKCHFKDFVMNS